MTRHILFVCTGNICRSPMAEAFFNHRAQKNGVADGWNAQSAGTWALEHQPATAHAHTVMARRGIDLRAHRAQTITARSAARADAIIVMTQDHRDAVHAQFGVPTTVHLLSELAHQTYDIADPYGGTLEDYEACAAQIEALITAGSEQIYAWARGTAR